MSIIYTWELNPLQVKIKDGVLDNVVYHVGWQLNGASENISSSVYGSVEIGSPLAEEFTPFEQLSKLQVQEWVEAALGEQQVAKLKTVIEQAIDVIKNPSTKTLPPPWLEEFVAQ